MKFFRVSRGPEFCLFAVIQTKETVFAKIKIYNLFLLISFMSISSGSP